MAQRWHLLGMIVPRPSGGPEPIFVETQRNLHKHTDENLSHSPRTGIPHGGGINLPIPDSPEHPIQTVESLRIHLQTAMAVELSTIPLYLFGMYTVKSPKAFANDPRYDDPIVRTVRGALIWFPPDSGTKYDFLFKTTICPPQVSSQRRCSISV